MGLLAEKIYEEALNLQVEDRLILIDKLLYSTNISPELHIDQAWANEVEIRSQAIDRGHAHLIPGEEVYEKVQKRFAK